MLDTSKKLYTHNALTEKRRCTSARMAASFMLGAAALALAFEPAYAQIETVVVTAQKRAQDIQVVPVTVDAFTADDLRQSSINTVNDLQTISPSLFVYTTTAGPSDTTIKVRGVGTTGNNPGLEGAVGTFIDGVYRNRSGLALGDLVDIERIEVLEGPQSTLFGKNTSAGAINILTNAPDQTHSGFVEAGLSNYGGYKVDGWVNLPVSDDLATRWDGVYNKRDGFIRNENTGNGMNDRNRFFLKGQALWTPTNDVSLRIIADVSHGNEHCCAAVRVVAGEPEPLINELEEANGAALTTPSNGKYVESINGAEFPLSFGDAGGSAELNWQLNDAVKLTNIVAYRDFSQRGNGDYDFTGASILSVPNAFRDRVFSEELRFSGHQDFGSAIKSVDWLAGGFYSNEQIRVHTQYLDQAQAGNYWCGTFFEAFGLDPSGCLAPGASAAAGNLPKLPSPFGLMDFNLFKPNTGDDQHFSQSGESWSGFVQATLNITDQFSVTGGLRYGTDRKSASAVYANNNPQQSAPPANYNFPFWIGTVFPYDQSESSSALTGTVNAQYFVTDNVMAYVSYSRGYKSGGYNLDRTGAGIDGFGFGPRDPEYKPEYSDNMEFGIKTKWWDNKLLINATAFDEKFHQLQVLNFDGINYHISNVPSGTSAGFEVQAQANLFEGFDLSSSVTYADTEYGVGAFLTTFGPFGENPDPVVLTGHHFTNSPMWSTSEGATYTVALGESGLSAALHGDLFYGSSRNTGSDLNPVKEQAGYTLFNGRATLMGPEDRWELAAWCRNCTNKHYYTVVYDSVGQNPAAGSSFDGFVGDPVMYGVTGSIKF